VKRALFFAVVLFVASGLRAEGAADRFGVGGAAGVDDALARKTLRDRTGGNVFRTLWLRAGISEKTEFMAGFDSFSLKPKNAAGQDPVRIRPLTLGLWHSFHPARRWTPVLTAGLGVADTGRLSPQRRSRTAFAAQAGAGVEYFVVPNFSVGALARTHYVLNHGDQDRIEGALVSAGLTATVFWGRAGAAPEPVAAPLPPTEPAAPAPVALAADSDGDGVEDARDGCPGSPPGSPVNEAGCPRDADGDGVMDALDKCPGTPPGSLVNSAGCPAEKVTVILDIKFDPGKSDVKPAFEDQIRNVADFLTRITKATVVIEGHTDSAGNPATSLPLSQRRAEAVRKALIEKFSVDPRRVSAKGFGHAKPVATNATPQGRTANRRVVATLSATKE